jgi:hypothetical protein
LGSEVLQVVILTGLTTGTEVGGDLRRAIELAEHGIALTRAEPSVGEDILFFSPYLTLASCRGAYLAAVGRIAEGRDQLHQALQLARERDDFAVTATANSWLVHLACLSGETSGAVARGRAAVDAAERVGITLGTNATQFLGVAAGLEGDWPQAVRVLEQCHASMREIAGLRMTEARVLGYLALAYGHCGHPAARATAERAVAVAQERHVVSYEIEAQLSLARVLLASGDAGDRPAVDAALARAAACVDESGARAFLPMIMEERAALARLRGDEAGRARELRHAHALYVEIGATGHAARLARELTS